METSPSYIGLPEGIYTDTNKRKTFLLYQIWKDLEGDLFSLWTFIFRHAKPDAYPKKRHHFKAQSILKSWGSHRSWYGRNLHMVQNNLVFRSKRFTLL